MLAICAFSILISISILVFSAISAFCTSSKVWSAYCYHFTEVPLVRSKCLMKGRGIGFIYKPPKAKTFFIKASTHPPLVLVYYFPLAYTLLSFPHAFTHNSSHYLFCKDNNWQQCFMEEKKTCIKFRKKTNDIFAWWKEN